MLSASGAAASRTAWAWSVQHLAGIIPVLFRLARETSLCAKSSCFRGCHVLCAGVNNPNHCPSSSSRSLSPDSWYADPPHPKPLASATCSNGLSPDKAATSSSRDSSTHLSPSFISTLCAATHSGAIGHSAAFLSCFASTEKAKAASLG